MYSLYENILALFTGTHVFQCIYTEPTAENHNAIGSDGCASLHIFPIGWLLRMKTRQSI